MTNRAYDNKFLQGKKSLFSLNFLVAEEIDTSVTMGIEYPVKKKKKNEIRENPTLQTFPYYKHISRTIEK